MIKILESLFIFFLIIFYPIKINSAEILQINSSDSVLLGDQNRNLSIKLFCVDINEEDEKSAINLLKKEFPRGSKVKIKPFGFEDNILVAKVFNISETREMTEVLFSSNFSKETCKN